MASLDDLKKRISSVKSTQKITKAMKMVAAAKLRRAQESAEKGRPYSDKMNNIILNLSNGISDIDNAPKLLSGNGEDKVHLCVVMTSDRGLCGGFNTNIIKKAKLYFQKILDEGKTLKIITVGSKGFDQLKYLIDEIKQNPTSRRLIINSWNANDIDKLIGSFNDYYPTPSEDGSTLMIPAPFVDASLVGPLAHLNEELSNDDFGFYFVGFESINHTFQELAEKDLVTGETIGISVAIIISVSYTHLTLPTKA